MKRVRHNESLTVGCTELGLSNIRVIESQLLYVSKEVGKTKNFHFFHCETLSINWKWNQNCRHFTRGNVLRVSFWWFSSYVMLIEIPFPHNKFSSKVFLEFIKNIKIFQQIYEICRGSHSELFKPLDANITKWSNTLKQFVGKSRFTILWGLNLKG